MYEPDLEANKLKMKLIADELVARLDPTWTVQKMIEQLASMEFHCLENGKKNDLARETLFGLKSERDATIEALIKEGSPRSNVEAVYNKTIYDLDQRRDELQVETYAWQVAMLVLARKMSRAMQSWSKVQADLFREYQ